MSANLKILNNIGLNNSYDHQIDFPSKIYQTAFWNNRIIKSFNDLSYRFVNDHYLKIIDDFNTAKTYSYCCINTMISGVGKTYYYFIKDVKLLSAGENAVDNANDTIQLELEEDVYQTYMFDHELKSSYVKREHQDRFSENRLSKRIFNTEPENIELGTEYKKISESDIGTPDEKIWYLVYCSEPVCQQHNTTGGISTTPSRASLIKVNQDNLLDTQQLQTGYYIYLTTDLMPFKWGNNNTTLQLPVSLIVDDPKVVKIVATRYLPRNVKYDNQNYFYYIDDSIDVSYGGIRNYCIGTYSNDNINYFTMVSIGMFEDIDCYSHDLSFSDEVFTNINQNSDCDKKWESKLYTYPFYYRRINNQGKYSIVKNELCNQTAHNAYQVKPGLVNSTNQSVIPLLYNNENISYFNENRSDIDGQINLITDAWQNYMSRNSASINGGLASKIYLGTVGVAGSIASQNYFGAVYSGLSTGMQVANEIYKHRDLQNTPDDIRESATDTYNKLLSINDLKATEEIVRIQDAYFDKLYNYFLRYGYACNNFKVPNLKSRWWYNYIQTVGANIVGNLGEKTLEKLRYIYDHGVTIWHWHIGVNNYKFLDYSKENSEVAFAIQGNQ